MEQENAAWREPDKSELAAEGGARVLTRDAKRRYREDPARSVAKWERKERNARATADFQKMAAEHPGTFQQSAVPHTAEMETETEVCQRGKGSRKEQCKGGKENRCRFGKCRQMNCPFVTRHPAAVLVLIWLFASSAIW